MFLESHPQKVANLGSDLGLVRLQNTLALKQPSWSPIPIPRRTEHLCGTTIKCKWERDALRPGIRLFLESHPPNVADLGSDLGLSSLDCGSETPSGQASGCFWSRTLQKLLVWAQILVSLDCKRPWLDSHPGPRFQYHGNQNTFAA